MDNQNIVESYNAYRSKMNERILDTQNLGIKRFFAMDKTAFADGVLDVKTKEMLGLAASMVLRCDDCIRYHVQQSHEAGVNKEEMEEVFSIALLVGGSVVIPHLRKATEFYDALLEG